MYAETKQPKLEIIPPFYIKKYIKNVYILVSWPDYDPRLGSKLFVML